MLSDCASFVLPFLWRISWQAAVFAVLIWVVCRAASRAPARLRYGLWMLVLVKFFVPPFAQLPAQLAVWDSVGVPHSASLPVFESPSEPVSPMPQGSGVAVQDSAGSGSVTAPEGGSVRVVPDLSGLVLAAWVVGVAGMGGLLSVRYLRQARLVREACPAGESVVEAVRTAAGVMGVRRVPEVVFSNNVPIPALAGLIRPRIVLPAGMEQKCSERELEAILLHEIAHLRRRDTLGLWVQQIAQVLFFFHPAVWLGGREMKVERELACDELVLSSASISPRAYAAGYMAALKLANAVPAPATTVAMAEPFEVETRRITMIFRNAVPKLSRRWMAVFAAAVLGVPTFGGIASGLDKAPTTDDIRAAWDKQNSGVVAITYLQDTSGMHSAASASLSSGGGGGPMRAAGTVKETVFERMYIRTPEVFYQNGWKGRQNSVERKGVTGLGEERSIDYTRGKIQVNGQIVEIAEGEELRVVDDDANMWDMGIPETICFRTYPRQDDRDTWFLYGWLKYAKVAEKTEEIDGHECWKLDITDTGDCIVKHMQVWVDPAIGYCPRKVVMEGMATGAAGREVGEFKIVDEFSDFVEVSKGIWFPGKKVNVRNQPNAGAINRTMTYTLKEVLKDRSFAKADVEVKFEPGERVYKTVYVKNPPGVNWEPYTVAEDGSLVAVK